MERVICDICERDITRGVMLRSPAIQQIITVDTGYGIIKMELCDKCWKRMLYLIQNERSWKAVQNMSFLNRVKLAFMLPLKDNEEEEQ